LTTSVKRPHQDWDINTKSSQEEERKEGNKFRREMA